MPKPFVNPAILSRFNVLIAEGEHLWLKQQEDANQIRDPVRFAQWSTSGLNLLDKLSISTNRFVTQYELWVVRGPGSPINIGAALGVLKSARDEYELGFAIEYHLSVTASVFSGLLDEASYLCERGYIRAAAVLMGAALEEGLKARARAVPIELDSRATLSPVITELKRPHVGVLTEFEAKRLDALAKLRNDAAHGGDFKYEAGQVKEAIEEVATTLDRLLSSAK